MNELQGVKDYFNDLLFSGHLVLPDGVHLVKFVSGDEKVDVKVDVAMSLIKDIEVFA